MIPLKLTKTKSKPEDKLAYQIKIVGLPEPVRQYRFAAEATGGTGRGSLARIKAAGLKDWRFDFCYPELKLAIEVEGVTGGGQALGRHQRAGGMTEDCRKYGAAMLLGFDVYRCTQELIKSGHAIKMIQALYNLKTGV